MNSNRKNASTLRYEAQCQARHKRFYFVSGLVLGVMVLALVWMIVPRSSMKDATASQPSANVAADAHSPLVMYARDTGARIDQQVDQAQSPHSDQDQSPYR